MAIFFPTRSACSITKTLRPRLPASIAQKRPAAPAPMIMTSHSCIKERVQQTGAHACDLCDAEFRKSETREAGGSIKPGVERSETPGTSHEMIEPAERAT